MSEKKPDPYGVEKKPAPAKAAAPAATASETPAAAAAPSARFSSQEVGQVRVITFSRPDVVDGQYIEQLKELTRHLAVPLITMLSSQLLSLSLCFSRMLTARGWLAQ